MKLSRTAIILLASAALLSASGCSYINRIRAKSELNQVAQNYKDKKYAEAEAHAKRALELDPDNESAPLFVARTIHAQVRRGDKSDANMAKANEAIDAYKKIEAKDPNNDEAFSAVTVLYGQLDQPDEQIKWVEQRASNEAVSPEKRSVAYAILSDKDWQCSIAVTDNNDNKKTVQQPDGKVVIQYTKPKDQQQFDQAKQCVTRGLERVEKAISLNPNNENAYGQKYKLLQEAKKLALMEDKKDDATQYAKQAEDAAKKAGELRKQNQPTPAPTSPPST